MKYLSPFLIIGLLLVFGFHCSAQKPLEAPKTIEEAESLGKNFLFGLPEAMKKPWQEALTLWTRMINWVRPWVQAIWYKISSFLGKEVEKKKPEIKQEFEKEKQEMKEEIPKIPEATKSLWQRFKELIK